MIKISCTFCGKEIVNPLIERIPTCKKCKLLKKQFKDIEAAMYMRQYRKTERGMLITKAYQSSANYHLSQMKFKMKKKKNEKKKN